MVTETLTECPFCGKKTIHIFHQPFVSRKSMSKSRFGTGGPVFTKERFDVLSGCDACEKTQKEVDKALSGKVERSHEERLEIFRKRGLPLVLCSKKEKNV